MVLNNDVINDQLIHRKDMTSVSEKNHSSLSQMSRKESRQLTLMTLPTVIWYAFLRCLSFFV